MSQMALQTLVGTALIDSEFRGKLLNGKRHTLLPQFDLTDEERQVIMGVNAESIQGFAAQLHEWLQAQTNPLSHPNTDRPTYYAPLRSSVMPTF